MIIFWMYCWWKHWEHSERGTDNDTSILLLNIQTNLGLLVISSDISEICDTSETCERSDTTDNSDPEILLGLSEKIQGRCGEDYRLCNPWQSK